MWNSNHLMVLLLLVVLTTHTVKSQEPCTRSPGFTDPNIAGAVYESSVLEFDPNSPLYRTDTTIEGINGGSDVNSGVTLTIARTTATPSSVNLNDLIELVTETVSGSFGSRTYIRLKKEIDRDGTSFTAVDDLDTIEFEISCVSLKSPTETKYFLVQLEIRDINDNPPIFVNAPYTAAVDESAPVGTTVYSGISATDLDAGSNKEIEFAIVAGDGSINDGSTRFLLPITSRGEIVVRQPLDFESVQSYTLTISATDKASNPADRRQATTTITISVNDVDDLGPKFVYAGCVEVDNVCFNPTYSTSVTSGSTGSTLVFNPVPPNSGNPNAVVNIVAEDRDTLNAPINFAIQQTLPTGYQNRFQVTTQQVSGSANQYQAIVTQTSPLDRSQVPELELFIEARETLTNRYSNRATIKMTIAAANNNNPVLTVPFQGFIYENSPVGTIPRNSDGSNLLKISVTDPDLISGEIGTYSYTVSGTSLFRVNSEGYVEAAASINYETNPVVTFTVTGTEVGTQNPRSGSVQVTVNVRDLNDNSPVFEAPRYTDTIVEGDYTTSNQVLLDVKATDDDSGAFGDIAYTIQSVSNNGASKFTIQPSSQQGQATISCVGAVAEGEIYVIMVQATDQGQPIAERRSTSVPVEVTVTPLGTRPPVIDAAAFTISVSEAVPIGSSLWTVPARDPEGLPLTFTITAGNVNSDFIINSTTGELRTARRLNREGTPQYTLNIQVQDQSGLTAQTTLTIIVQDVNDNNPVFIPTSYTFSVFEGRTNEPVGTVTATDADTGANALVNYQISPYSSTDSANLFFITSTGAITTATALDYEVKQRHVILVLGTDGGVSSRTGTATVTINVQDVQDVIPLFTETNIERSIPERQPTGTSVAQVLAIDQDTVDSITYKFSTGDFTVFNINSNSGVITNNQLLQYETKSRYVFTVTTAEGESSNALSATATVTINIQDINNYPPVIQPVPSNLQFLENIPVGTELLSSITVTDADAENTANSRVTFRITSVTSSATVQNPNLQQWFYINPETGKITLARSFQQDPGVTSYNINVNVQDGGVPPLSASTTVTITVIRNTAPFFPAPKTTTVTIPNTRNSGSEVITYTATDNDARPEFNQVTYSMVTDTTAASLFRLEPTSGRITLVSSLTADDAPRYLLTITATDNGGLSDTGTVTVSVDRNLNDPQWLPTGGPYSATVNETENRPVLETVYTLSTQDLDVQEPFNTRIYSILSTSSAAQHFQISSQGNVQIIRSLAIDRAVNQYVLTIQLRDGGNKVAAQQFTLTVNVIRNTNPPVFFDTSYYQEIEETLAVGTSILRVQASDQDPELQFRTITYTLLANTAGNNLFSMEQGTGIIRVKSALTGDPTVTFNMVAVATDGGSPSQSANAMVTIKVNRNRNTPVWNSLNYQATILETQTVALPLTLSPTGLSASDSDAQPPNNVVNYRLTAVVARSGSTVYANEQGNFAVSSTGQVTVRSPLIGLTATEYLLYVEAYDLGDPSRVGSSNATVTINVQRNRAPVFAQTSYTFEMNEDATVNPQTLVGQVLANDPDNGIPEFNTLSYAIENIGIGSPNAYLAIDSNGRITLQNIVSGIQDKEFRFLVRVSDNGVPSLTDEAVVTVNIKRNLWTPAFNPLNYAVTIQETLPVGAEIGVTVAATDQDLSAPNNQVVYSANGDQSAIQYFDIDETSGKVLVKQPLYTGTSSQYILTVRVADSATPPLESQQTASVTITVERNQFPPVFRNLPTTRSLPRTAGFGFSVYTVFANDSDIRSPFNVVSYSLVSGTNQFQIDQTTGQITLQTNSLTQAEYVLTVEARDGADIPRRSYSTLTLTVDSNLEKPVWVNPGASSSYEATVTIYETHDYVTSVFSFSANDFDSVSPYNTVRYVVEGNGNAPNFFTVADNGQTFLKTSLLQRTETQFVLVVRAEDGGNPPRQADNKTRLTINVIRNNNAPQWQNPMTTTLVSQQAGVGQTVGNALLATDSDVFFNVVRYEIIGDGDSTAFFTIANPANGQITVANSLASSSDLVYYIRVRAYDNGVPAKDNVTVVTVTVERNNFAPEITSPTVSERIPETQDLGVTIATVTATDRDTQSPHNVIRFRMFASTPASDYFGIDSQTGTIFVKRDLTLDTSNRYLMYVQAYDMGSPSKTSATNATVTIDIFRNLRDPFFSGGPFAANIPETSVIGLSVLQVNFADSDTDAPFNTVTVSAIGDDKALTYFRLESNGQINVNSDLKADSDTQYLMRILAQDGGSPPRTATTVATITVQRNINSPVFERQSYNETILETRQLGLSFLQVKATDGDTRAPYNEVRYFMSTDAGSTLGAQYFMVDDVTGDISLRQSPMLDNARTVDYTFTVNAVDRGGSSATLPASVRVTVIRNTNTPVFTNLPNANQINHNTSIGTQVFPVSARDPDPGVFGQLTYSLTGDGESTSVFDINRTSGVITLQQSLFSQTSTLYTLRVRVQDGGSPRKEAMNTLTLTVQRNFETPRFVSNSYTFTIKENEPIGFSVGQIVATDADSAPPNNLVEYYFVGSTPSQRFLIDSRTGVITIRKDLTTEETPSSYTFRVQARDSGSPQRLSQEIPLTINIQRNDYDPLFGNLPFSVTIPANANQFSTVYTVNSTDADTVLDFQRREYDIIGDDAATSLFAVDPTAGRITIRSPLTSDPAVQYRVRVRVRDFGTPRRSSTSLLLVNVTRNLNAPQFNPTQYSATILETQTLGSSIRQVSSSDLDTTAPNNVPTYTLSGNALALQYFQVNPSTGVVSLYKDLRDDTATSYTLTVTVADNGSPSLAGTNTATVTVQVNRNLQPPRFINAPYSSTITRLVTDNSLLPGVTVSTADDDTVSPFRDVTVSVIGDDSAASLFELVGSSVRVRNAANLAADTANTYKLRLLAEDGGSPKKTATTTIDITVRRNMVPPQFNPTAYNATILENYPVGSEIVTVSATDSDPQPPNNQFKYSITGDTTAMTYFYINPDSGRISLKQSIKGTGVNQFRLQVTATDEGTPPLSGQAIVTVDVTIDDTLRFTQLQPYIASIDENDPVDRGFITVIATPQPNIKYSIVGFSDSPDYFKIDETTGVISVKTDLRSDLSKRTTYLIQVRAEKQFPNGLQSVENLVNVTVLRNINPPVFNSTQYQANINEKYGLGQSVVQVFATDLDTQDVLLYSIIDQAGETEPFYMAPSTGIITLKQLLTGTTKTRYAFTVQVRDQSKPEKFGQSTVVINVRRNSQPPVFERTPYGAAINYNQAPGPVYTTSARDPDLTGTLTYEVIGYFSAPGYFTVNSNGEVVLLSSLASDTAQSYTLGLAAYDSDYPNDKAYANVTITVNRNPNAPDFTNPSYSITVNESYPLAVSLLQVSGQDADQHVVEYILESSNPIDGTQFFYLNPSTGVLTVSRPLTETGTQTFTLQVRLRDNGIPARSSATTAPVTIFITRNNNGPIFAGTFTTNINETTPTNTAVLTVAATDSDPNTSPYGQLRYRVIGDGDFTQFFDINPTTGSISVQRPLTSQDVALYQGRIVAEDGGSPPRSATATAIINILRNLNDPVFNPKSYTATIYETHQVGDDIVTVTATDADQIRPNNEIIFEMTDTTPNLNNAGLNYFSIRTENNRGLISITLPLYTDNLNTAVYTFSVRARDNGSPTRFAVDAATVTINVNRNLFPPIFQGEPYTASLNFNSPSGSTVRQVNATDADAQSPHNTVTYSIIGDGTAQTLFSINPATGLITTRQSLQNNNVERSSILVMARDGGTPSLTATSTVLVTIARNLNAPEWTLSAYTVNITETQDLGTPIAALGTRDDDVEAPYNTRITTLTGDTNMMQFFSLSENGQLSVKKQLTSTNIRTFTGTVSLRDGGNPPLTPTGVQTATITVYVTKNDHTPYFINEPYSKDLEGTIQLGASVFQVTARDDDRGLFGLVRFKITGDDLAPNYFRIDENSGLISIKNVLSGVNQNQFKVRVEAYDGGSPSKTNVSVVTLTVKSNYQRPIFNQPSYFARIPETQSLGQRIIAVTANDSDALAPNNVVRYSLTEGADDIECFLIDAQTGSLSLRRSLLYAPCTGSRYQMTVTATDLGLNPLSNTITVTVDVDRNANPPVFQNIPAIAPINENQPTSQGFFTVRATDADTVSPFGDITYSLVGDGTATIYFQVDSSTGVVSLKQSIQPDTASTYRLTFRATDGGNPSKYDEKILTVNVNRNLLAPEFVQQIYEVTIWEIQALDTVIQEVSARDNDTKAPHNEVTYEIVGDTLAQTYFRIDNEGRIYVRRPLTDDNADTGLYTVSVRANDKGTPQRSSSTLATVRVNVLRNRNCPTFASSVVDIPIDQSSVSRVIYDANATDPDAANTPFSTVRYSLIGDENAQIFFRVNDQTGQVSTNEPSLFSDQGTIYQLRVRAEDAVNTVTSCSGTLVLRVSVNRNLNSPQWKHVNTANNYVATISETHSVSLSVYRIQAVDADDKVPNNVVTYAMTANSPNRNLFFVDVDGFVYLRNSLVGITGDRFTVRFVATDGGNPARTSPEATLTVNVNRNQFPPEILNLPAEKEIQENQLVNEEIYRVNGRDNDTFAPFNAYSFKLVGDGSSTTFLQVSQGGAVTLRQSISSDPATTFQLRILASDGGYPPRTATTILIIRVQRNLNAPVFDRRIYYGTVLEQDRIGRPFTQVFATDSDLQAPHNRIIYRITESETTAINYFYLHPETGHISLNQCTNGTDNRFIFNITATDGGSPPLSDHALVDVEVKGCPKCRTNINSPRFFAPVYFVNIKEGDYSKNNLQLIQISATDDDDGYDGDILFDIQSVSNNGNDKFKLEQDHLNTNANIICSGTLNRGETYVIMVRASDQALQMDRRRSSSVPVEVRVVP